MDVSVKTAVLGGVAAAVAVYELWILSISWARQSELKARAARKRAERDTYVDQLTHSWIVPSCALP